MPITLLNGGTTATTGGTDQIFERTNEQVVNGHSFSDTAEADFFKRKKLTLSCRGPYKGGDGLWKSQVNKTSYAQPITLADGTIHYNVARNEIAYHPQSTAAQIAELREMNAQLCKDAELNPFYGAGTLPA